MPNDPRPQAFGRIVTARRIERERWVNPADHWSHRLHVVLSQARTSMPAESVHAGIGLGAARGRRSWPAIPSPINGMHPLKGFVR